MGERVDRPASNPASSPSTATPDVPQQVRRDEADARSLDRVLPGDHVNTAWSLNFQMRSNGAGKSVAPRTPESSLYVDDLAIAPDGDPGRENPVPQHFRGVTLARTGASFLGSLSHPKGRAGVASAAVSFGARPRFDFKVTSQSRGDLRAIQREHAAVVRELSDSLDDFVDNTEAQAALDRIIASRATDDSTKATVRRVDGRRSPTVNTTDLRYSAVNGDKTFRLGVQVPSVAKDKSMSYSTTSNGESVSAKEQTSGTATETETSTTTTLESQRTTQLENTLRSGVKHTFEAFLKDSYTDETITREEKQDGIDTINEMKLNGGIKGGFDLGDIPVIGWLAKKLIGGKLEVSISPNFESKTTISGKKVSSKSTSGSLTRESGTRSFTEADAENIVKHLMTVTLKSQVALAVKVKRSQSDGTRISDGEKETRSTSSSTTVGSVQVIAVAAQPVLVEE